MLKRTNYISGTIGLLIGLVLLTAPSAAQELAWYERAVQDPVTQQSDVVRTVHGIEGGLLVGGTVNVQSKPVGEYLRRIDADGQELWRLDIPPSGRAAGQYIQSLARLITPHRRGGWWYVAKYMDVDSRTTGNRYFFIRHLVSADGRLLSSAEGVGGPSVVTSDGTVIELAAEGWVYTWRMIDPAAGTVDSVSFDLESVRSTMNGNPIVAWSKTESDRAFLLLTDPYLGECVLTSVDLRTGYAQSVRLDDVPTVGLGGAIMPDGSVVVLARESRWREGELHDLVLIRPGIEGGAYERVHLPLSATYTPELLGTLSNGDVIFSPSNQIVENRLYRISPDGASIRYLQFISVAGWSLSIAPDDAMYVYFGYASTFGKVAGSGITSSVSEEDESDRQWLDLDLSGVE